MTLTWTLPLTMAPLQNEIMRMHWTKKESIKAQIATVLLCQHRRPKVPLAGRPTVNVTRRSTRECDADSGHGGKLVLDALVRLGWLRDDSPDAIALAFRWEKARPGKGALVVEVVSG